MKYILVTGGVISGIGKGIVTSSVGALLKACNLKVTAIKIDPYINIDAGTFSPYEHGEVYVLNDGCEVDLDLGNYERFLDVELHAQNNITTGKIYQEVIQRERQGDYLGKTVTIVPHITDAIQERIERTANGTNGDHGTYDVCIIELGGTIGDIEGMPFVEALRQLQWRKKRENLCLIHVNLVPCIGPSEELKTKPTQESVHKLRSFGLSPDMIVCRSSRTMTIEARKKISYYSNLEIDNVLSLPDLKSIYKVPVFLKEQGILRVISECLKLSLCPCQRLSQWEDISKIAISAEEEITVALVGKYTSLQDCYTSVVKSIEHACYKLGARPKLKFIDAEFLEGAHDNSAWTDLKSSHCLLVPGGFGIRGTQGKINAIKWARLNKMPYLGICLGFQLAVIEICRNELSIGNAHSAEFEAELSDFEPVVVEMLEYADPDKKMGGTMRLGLRSTKFVVESSILKGLYGNTDTIHERHRHRYEINPQYIGDIEKVGLKFVGRNEDGTRMEIFELDPSVHPYFVGVQFHPEYLSRPFRPSPPFRGLIEAARCYNKFK